VITACNRLSSTHCRNSPSASFLPFMSHKPGYPCDAAAGSVTFSAKVGATIIPAARIEKAVTSFDVASILYPYRCWLEPRLQWVHCNIVKFGNVAVTKHSHFWSTIGRTISIFCLMSAATPYSAEPADTSRCICASALGNWR